ncbi:MAG: FkbM family methyltransferase [Gemmataceae bacterium]
MLAKLVSLLPASWIRSIGILQFRVPVLGPIIGYVGRNVLATQGTIRHGIGAGLKFDASGGVPGFLFGTSEPHEQAALAQYLKPGDVFYDIGANVGFFATRAAHLVGPEGKVYAFEPFPQSAEKVRKNAALNDFKHVEVIEAAVSSEPGEATLKIGAISGQNSLRYDNQHGAVKVAVVSIDDMREKRSAPGPKLVMIDAEGAEVEVLKGMANTIKECRPVIMVEVHWLGDEFLDYCRENIESIGYTIRPLVGEKLPEGPVRYHAVLEPNVNGQQDDSDADAAMEDGE